VGLKLQINSRQSLPELDSNSIINPQTPSRTRIKNCKPTVFDNTQFSSEFCARVGFNRICWKDFGPEWLRGQASVPRKILSTIKLASPLSMCPVLRPAVIEVLTAIRSGKWHVVTASKCRIYCFDSYSIPFRDCAAIIRRHYLWLHGDRRGGIFGRTLFDAV